MIYDLSEGFQNATVIVADSGKIQITKDKKNLQLTLYDGESFENIKQKQQRATKTQKNIPYRRETFAKKTLLRDFDSELSRYDESILQDQHVAKNVVQLVYSIDSVNLLAHEKSRQQSDKLITKSYFGRERMNERELTPVAIDERTQFDVDSLYAHFKLDQKRQVLNVTLERVRTQRDQIEYNTLMLEEHKRYVRKHEIELHRKFTLAFACLIFFFIGAPLGAIIRKGGLGAPVVISVVMFIIYYIIDNTGYKMAREAIWPCWAGMWLSSFALLPVGIFLTYKAATDSGLFNPEVWKKVFEKMIGKVKTIEIKQLWTLYKKH
jgi:lipopolysaccharide export system permease protein